MKDETLVADSVKVLLDNARRYAAVDGRNSFYVELTITTQ